LLRKVDHELVDLLKSLGPEEWDAQTVAPQWRVRDVAAHLLDTSLRGLSMGRDGFYAPHEGNPPDESLVEMINRLNADGVRLYRRLSPAVLIRMIEVASDDWCSCHESRDPFAPSSFGVNWAGQAKSMNWFDTARELTERWHHQQQIRLAVNRPGIMTPELYHPVLHCFLRGLPHAYRGVSAQDGTTVHIVIAGDCGDRWVLERNAWEWRLMRALSDIAADAGIEIPQEIAWRVFTKGIDRNAAERRCRIAGDRNLALPVLHMTAIVG
jgi:uncharacterized protein (TIGR03083 family)